MERSDYNVLAGHVQFPFFSYFIWFKCYANNQINIAARVPQDLVTTGGKCMILKWVTGWSFLLSSKLTSLLIPAPIWPFCVCLHLCILFFLKLIDANVLFSFYNDTKLGRK